MKIAKIITIILMLLTILLSTSCFSISTRNDHKLALEYLSQFEHNENIMYEFIDGLYYNGEIILKTKELSFQPINILYATNDFFYYKKRENGFDNVYKSDYALQSNEKIFSTIRLDGGIAMKNEETIVYYNRTEGLFGSEVQVYEYDIVTKEQSLANNGFWENLKSNAEYLYDENQITKKLTNETKTIKINDILMVDQAKILDDYLGIRFRDIRLYEDKIYVVCQSTDNFGFNSIITIYLYDFETEEYIFFDWVYTIDDAESYSAYFF